MGKWENYGKTIGKPAENGLFHGIYGGFSWEWDLPSGIFREILALWDSNGNLMVFFRSESTKKR